MQSGNKGDNREELDLSGLSGYVLCFVIGLVSGFFGYLLGVEFLSTNVSLESRVDEVEAMIQSFPAGFPSVVHERMTFEELRYVYNLYNGVQGKGQSRYLLSLKLRDICSGIDWLDPEIDKNLPVETVCNDYCDITETMLGYMSNGTLCSGNYIPQDNIMVIG